MLDEADPDYAWQFKVVPHHRGILMDWDGHANLEYCGDAYTVLYLYKYLFKGQTKKAVEIRGPQENGWRIQQARRKDEIRFYIYGR